MIRFLFGRRERMKHIAKIFLAVMLISTAAYAKVDLVTLPTRDTVQITIYNSADLTLVRESRALTLKKGENKLQFAWVNTLIDPTSLEMLPKANADKIDILELTYPPRTRELGLWNINSHIGGKVPVEITYFTSGITWRAFYMGTLTEDERTMRLQGYVRVTNNSGEDYENAQTRLIVGKVHILDLIATLARMQYPFGRPGVLTLGGEFSELKARAIFGGGAGPVDQDRNMPYERQKEIRKEGLSEYFLYTIEGTETIPNGWSKRLPSFDADDVPVVNLYKYEEERYGNQVVRFLNFKNDEEHMLGETPIPGGMLRVYRTVDREDHLSYAGQSSFKYIPVGEDVELNIGTAQNVFVEPKLIDYSTANYLFDSEGDITGWDEIREFRIKVKNTRDLPVRVEIKRNFNTTYWEIEKDGDFDEYEQVDKDTVRFTLQLKPRSSREFTYVVTTFHGKRAEK
jgi:hypothetical protein